MKLDTVQSFHRGTREMIKLIAAQREARRKEYNDFGNSIENFKWKDDIL